MSKTEESGRLAHRSVLIVSAGVPHPHEGASTVLFYQYIRGIATSGARVLNLLLTDATNRDQRLLNEYVESMRDIATFEVLERFVNPLYRLNRWTREPRVQELPAPVVERVRAFAPDTVVCLDVLAAAYATQLAPADTRVVWLGDLHFQTFWYNALYDVKDRWTSAPRLPLVAAACHQWKRFYRRTLERARAIVVSSKASEDALGSIGVSARYLPYPWPAKADSDAPVVKPVRPTFAFFGSLSGLGSRSAFDMLIKGIYPELRRMWGSGGFTLLLAGSRQAPAWVQQALARTPEVIFNGYVEDLVTFMRGCHAVVVPIDVPVGNRSRILTAMAHGVLVVAHENTRAGNPDLVSGDNCLLAASPLEFARHLRFSVEQGGEGEAIARRGREMYERLFSPAPAVDRFLEVLA